MDGSNRAVRHTGWSETGSAVPEVILEAAGGRKGFLVAAAAAVVDAGLQSPHGLHERLGPRADALADLGQAAVHELERVLRASTAAIVVIVQLLK